MSPEHASPSRDLERDPPPTADRGRAPGPSAPVPALVTLLIPLLVVPAAALFVAVDPGDDGRMPLWAIEAFGSELLSTALAAATLPTPILIALGLVPLLVPPLAALLGLGSVARWAALAGFCLIGAGLSGLLGLGVLLRLIAPGAFAVALRLELLACLGGPLLAIEACGCLLAASAAPAGVAALPGRVVPRRGGGDSI